MPIPPSLSPPYHDLPDLIQSVFRSAVEKDQIQLFDAAESSIHRSGFDHLIYIAPSLDEKPGAPHKTPDLDHEPKKDPFDGPEFEDGQSVADLGEHVVLNNLNALREEHCMLIAKEFRPQASDLLQRDLETAYAVLQAYAHAGREVLCFFNGGPAAGASQPHLHIQFVPFPDGKTPGAEALAERVCESKPEVPMLLPTQHAHYALLLPDLSTSASRPLSPSQVSSTLFECYKTMLNDFNTVRKQIGVSDLPETKAKRESYNILLTTRHLHLIPRSSDAAHVPHPRLRKKKGVEAGEEMGEEGMTLNGLTFSGVWFVGSQEEKQDLLAVGCEEALMMSGYDSSVSTSDCSGHR